MELDVAPGSQRKPSWVEDNKPCAAYRAQTLRQHPSLMAAARELEDSLAVALRSSAIEWAVNVQICDLIKENRHLAPLALARIEERLRKDSPSPVHLALSLLEMLVKNCGLIICQAINPDLAETLVSLVKKRESWRYGFGRNLHKTGLSEWLPQGIAIGEDQRAQWRQATQKVLEILQLSVDAFMLHEGTMRPVFNAYKRLRREGYQFPRSSTGVAANLCLVNGAENSPAYLAGATPSAGTPAPTIAPAPQPSARPSAEAEDEEIARMIGARADASERVEQLVQAVCLWRHLLFDRTAFDYSSSPRSQIPASFFPLSTLREVSVAHEAMCPQNRLASTVAFMTVMRYLMSEIAQTLEVAEAIARTNEGTQEAEDLDEGDAANLMQRTVKETVSDGHRLRWTRALARLQKELAGQGTGARGEHIRRLRQGLAGCADPRHEWCEQLEALLLAMQGEETGARGDGTMDPQWISGWFGELGILLQGFGLPVLVESQTETQGSSGGILGTDAQLLNTRGGTQPRDGTSAEKEHDFEMHLRDEQEARADRELRDRELADYQAQQEEFERLKAQELCILQEQAREYQAQEDRLMTEALSRPAKRRCVVSLELATGSGDKPKVLHTLSAEVPEDGGSLTLVMRASFEPEADTVSTIGVPSPSREVAAGGGQSQGVPDATLSQLDFHEFESLYSEWRDGKKSSIDIAQQYGNEVVELLEAQKAVAAVEDEEQDNGPGHGLEGGIGEVVADALGSQGDSPTHETSAMMAPGQPRIRFALFESIYGQWKAGWRSDEAVQRGLSPLWLHLFRLWRAWGLEAIEPYLAQELDMRRDPSPDEPALLISDPGEAQAVPVVPLSCVMVTFVAWCRGELTDAQVQGLQGDAWLLRLRQLRETGLQGVAMVLGKEALEQGRDFDPQELEELITLVEDISEVLRAMGVEDEDGRPKAPPPSSVPPGAIGVRNVPAARVISESPEGLLIDDTGGASQFEPESSDRSPSRPSASPEDLGDPLYDAPGSAAGNALLGGRAKKRASRGWSQWAESMRSMAAGGSRTRRLGDGVPRSAYADLGEAGTPLFQ
eukprot:s2302_g5.t2